jgi:hypothetical protein
MQNHAKLKILPRNLVRRRSDVAACILAESAEAAKYPQGKDDRKDR